jgi:hypothetical protein
MFSRRERKMDKVYRSFSATVKPGAIRHAKLVPNTTIL